MKGIVGLPDSLTIWSANDADTTYYTKNGDSLVDMVDGKIPLLYWRVIHGKNDTTKPFITKHVGDDVLFIIGQEDPIFNRLLTAHMGAIE